jgi:predicted NAD-dependent protein-ADP-ribosyltransferase YbiA (DUF1768 family)
MAIRFFSKSETHREFSNFAPFGIDLDDAWWPTNHRPRIAQGDPQGGQAGDR